MVMQMLLQVAIETTDETAKRENVNGSDDEWRLLLCYYKLQLAVQISWLAVYGGISLITIPETAELF